MKRPLNALSLAVMIALGLSAGCATQTEPEAEPTPPPAETKQPEQQPVVEAPPAAAPTSQYGNYVVVRGDNLWNIAGKSSVYGNPYQWPLIYRDNQDKIKDADLIYPGQNFRVDNNPSAGDVDAAVRHAKTRGAWSIGAVEDSDKAYLSR